MTLLPSRTVKIKGARYNRPKPDYPGGEVMTIPEAKLEQRGEDWTQLAYQPSL